MLFRYLLLDKAIKKDSSEHVKKYKIANDNPGNEVKDSKGLINRRHCDSLSKHSVPVRQSQKLERRNKSTIERVKVFTHCFTSCNTVQLATAVHRHTQKRINEDEDENE